MKGDHRSIYATFAVAKRKPEKDCKSCVYTAMIVLHIILDSTVHIYDFSYIHNFVIILSWVNNEPIQRPAPSGLVSLIGRALHRYRRGQGFESCTSLNFLQAFFSPLQKLRIYRDDLPSYNSWLSSSHIWFSCIHNFNHLRVNWVENFSTKKMSR